MAIDEFKKCESCGDYLYECKCINPEDIYEEFKQLKEDLSNLVEKQLKEDLRNHVDEMKGIGCEGEFD